MMHSGLNIVFAREVEREFDRASQRGWMASADVVVAADRRRETLALWACGSVVASLIVWLVLPGAALEAAAAAAFASLLALARWAHGDRRRSALDRMVELHDLAVPGAPRQVTGAVLARRAQLLAPRHRRALAAAVRRSAALEPSAMRAASPGAVALAHEPELAMRIAVRLESEGDDGRLPVAVERLLSSGGSVEGTLDRVRSLVACAAC
jgi:hypothetical protein